jgi:hypothetical protein
LLSYPDEGGHRGALGVRRSLLDRALLHHARMSGVRVAMSAGFACGEPAVKLGRSCARASSWPPTGDTPRSPAPWG